MWVSDGGGRVGCNGGRRFEVIQYSLSPTTMATTVVDGALINGDFPPELCHTVVASQQPGTVRPRTTNLAEGFHNGINSRFGMPHPSLKTFRHWLQKCQFEVH